MNFENIVYEIESHPLVTAMAVFLIFFLGFNVFKKNTTAVTPTDTSTSDLPKSNDQYYQQYNSFPIATPTPSTTTTPITTPVSTPSSSQLKTVTSGWISDKPGGTNNTSGGVRGKNLVNVPKGTIVSLLGGPSTFNSQHYYHVLYGSVSGYINARTVGLS